MTFHQRMVLPANDATIGGKVEGDLDVKKRVTLGDTSFLRGNLKASILTIEEGAKFDGVCSMLKNSKPKNQDSIPAVEDSQ